MSLAYTPLWAHELMETCGWVTSSARLPFLLRA